MKSTREKAKKWETLLGEQPGTKKPKAKLEAVLLHLVHCGTSPPVRRGHPVSACCSSSQLLSAQWCTTTDFVEIVSHCSVTSILKTVQNRIKKHRFLW